MAVCSHFFPHYYFMTQEQLDKLKQLSELRDKFPYGAIIGVYNAPGSVSVGTIKDLDIENLIAGDPDVIKAIVEAHKKQTQATATGKSVNIKQIIKDCLDAVDDKGRKIFTERYQWYAVFRVLHEKCNYPDQMPSFIEKMEELNIAYNDVPYTYASLKYALRACPMLACKVERWEQYSPISKQYKKLCDLATWLLKKIDAANEPTIKKI